VFFKADLDEGWHLYGLTAAGGGQVKTTFTFNTTKGYSLLGDVTAPKPETRFEPAFNTKVNYYEKSVVFQQRIKLSENKAEVKGTIEYMVCSNRQCLPPETIEFSIHVN
jgi:DsbC/DsbD-like thiol-disulfide interchange protein